MKKILALALIVLTSGTVFSQSNTHEPKFVTPNSYVWSTARDGNTLYMGGYFTGVGHYTGNMAVFNQGANTPDLNMPFLNGTVYSIVPDSSGGWYVGGGFSVTIGTYTYSNLLHIKSNKTIDTVFKAATNGTVRGLAYNGTNLFVGGAFSMIKTSVRSNLASVNKTNGNPTSWNPQVNSTVLTLSLKDSLLITGGQFTLVDNSVREYLAVFNINTGLLMKNFPSANSYVFDTHVYGNTVYAGGYLSYTGKKTGYAVKMQGTSANPNYDFPVVNGTVYACVSDGSGGWYIGGSFSKVGAYNISNLAHIKSNNTVDTAFLPNPNSTVRALGLKGNTLYAGGSFSMIGGQARLNCGAVNKNTGVATGWNPDVNSTVLALFVKDTLVYIGGQFTFIDGIYRPYSACLSTANNADLKPYFTQANSYVFRFYNDNNLLYSGGYLSQVGFSNRYAAKLTTTNDIPEYDFPTTNGTIYSVVPDGSGGYYIGGSFSLVNNQSVSNLVHILADKSIDATFDPVVNGTVRCLAIDGGNLYLGGAFSTINGDPRTNLGAVNKTNGNTINSFRVDCNSTVLAMIVKNGILYVGGQFSVIDSVTREYAASVTLATAALTTWDPDPNSYVFTLLSNAAGSKIYLGGYFSTLKNATSRLYTGAVNTTNGTPTSWNPTLNGYCYSLLLNGANIIAGGSFSMASGAVRNYIAEFDTGSGNETSWNPNLNGAVNCLAKSGSTIYAGGAFTLVGATSRQYIAAINGSGNATSWDPRADNAVNALVVDGTNIIIGGSFTFLKSYLRSYAACANLNNFGVATNYNPVANSYVYAFAKKGSTVYLGGTFSAVDGAPRNNLAATDSSDGNVQSFNPDLNGSVNALWVQGTNVYAGGAFTTVGGSTTRNRLASFNTSTGALNTWDPAADNTVNDICYASSNLFIAGSLQYLGGGNRSYIMSFDLGTDKVNSWAPICNSYVYAVFRYSNKVYIGGSFSTVNSTTRYNLASVNATNGTLNTWNPGQANYSGINELLVINDTIYAGGNFTDPVSNYLLAIKNNGTSIATWKTNMNSGVYSLAQYNGKIAAGGAFTYSNYGYRSYVCAIDMTTGLLTDWAPVMNSYVYALLVKGSNVFLGGTFSTVNSIGRSNLAAVHKTTGVLQTWNPGANGTVNDLATDGNLIYAAGSFSMMNVSARNGLAAMNSTGAGAVQPWDPAANAGANFNAIFITGAKVFVGGTCSTVGGLARTNLALVDTDAVVLNWTPNPNGIVYDIAGDATNIYVAGGFSNISSTARNFLASYQLSNNSFRTWNPTILGSNVRSVSVLGTNVYFGGAFTSVKGSSRTNLASVSDAGTGTLQPWNPSLNNAVYTVLADAGYIFAGGAFSDADADVKQPYFRGYDVTPAPPQEEESTEVMLESRAAFHLVNNNAVIYPNPAADKITIDAAVIGSNISITILNSLGQQVYSSLTETSEATLRKEISLEELPPGLYFVSIRSGEEREVIRVVKE